MKDYEKLQKMIDESNNIVFFGGAGVSTESGVKDFRSVDGLYNEKYDYPPEVMLSRSFFNEHKSEFYKFYKDKLNCLEIEPNVTHKYLKKLEDSGKLKAVITQNIDGLHEKSGVKNVLLLHGTIFKNHCMMCGKEYDAEYVFNSQDIIPRCSCNGIIKPDVVLYEEPLDNYSFSLPENNLENMNNENDENNSSKDEISKENIYNSLPVNIDYIKVKYNTLINSDIILREFSLNIKGKEYKALLLFIDGMINSESVNNFVLRPLMSKSNSQQSNSTSSAITNNISVRRVKKFNLEDYVYDSLKPQNNMKMMKQQKEL